MDPTVWIFGPIQWLYETVWYSTFAEKLTVLVIFFGLFVYWTLVRATVEHHDSDT